MFFLSIHNLEGVFLRAFDTYKVLGYSECELIGNKPYDYFHPEDIIRVREMHFNNIVSDVVNDPSLATKVRFRYRHKNGKYIWVEGTSVTYNKEFIFSHIKKIPWFNFKFQIKKWLNKI